MRIQPSEDSVIGYFAAIAPALLQLLAVVSVGLVDVLRLDKFVLVPSFINIANFITILLSISVISLASFWDHNRFALRPDTQDPFSDTKDFWNMLRVACVLAVISFLVFIGIVLSKTILNSNVELWAFFQWSAYIISMTSVSFIIYAFVLLKIQERRSRSMYQNYIPRLMDSLRRHGHIKNPDVVIDSINRNELFAIVRIASSDKYKVYTDPVGEMVSIEKLS